MMFSSSLMFAQNDANSVLDRADRLATLRDIIVAEHASWSAEYDQEDTEFAKKQKEIYKQFGKRVQAESIPAVSLLKPQGVRLKFIRMPGLTRSDYEGDSSRSVLDLASGNLRTGPDIASLQQASAESGQSLMSLLAERVRELGDFAILENTVLISSGRYGKLGNINMQAYSGVDLSDQIKDRDPTCSLRKGDVLIIETIKKKYALVQYLGNNQGQVLLCIAFQPNGSAVFEFQPLPRPKKLDIFDKNINVHDLAAAMFVHNREKSFWKEARALTKPLSDLEKDARLPGNQRQRVNQIKKKIGITE